VRASYIIQMVGKKLRILNLSIIVLYAYIRTMLIEAFIAVSLL